MLAGALALKGRTVIAIDADPDANLGSALGVPADEPIIPLADMKELIRERTGVKAAYGGYFKLNPKVDDIPDSYARRIGPIRLLALGGVRAGGDGCICPASALLKALLVHLVLGRGDALIMDMEAGIEHLGRATAQSMDALLVVVNPDPWSAQTARRVHKLAGDIGMTNVFAVANRVTDPSQSGPLADQLGEVPLIGQLPTDPRLAEGIVGVDARGDLQPGEGLTGNLPAVEALLSELQTRTSRPSKETEHG